MNPKEHHEAFKFLHSELHPDEARIESLSKQQLDEHLESLDVDLKKLNARIAERKALFDKKLRFQNATKKLAALRSKPSPEIDVPATSKEILAILQKDYGEALPLAARDAKSAMTYEELVQLYRDLKCPKPDAR